MSNPYLESPDTNQVPDLAPISIPEQDAAPALSDRVDRIEEVLRLNS